MSIDVNSMYPLLGMVSFNMSPETYIEPHRVPEEVQDVIRAYFNSQDETRVMGMSPDIKRKMSELLKKHNIGLGINGAVFDNSKEGIIPKSVRGIYLDRKEKQKELEGFEKLKLKIQEELRKRAS